jgi:hypothetical protein
MQLMNKKQEADYWLNRASFSSSFALGLFGLGIGIKITELLDAAVSIFVIIIGFPFWFASLGHYIKHLELHYGRKKARMNWIEKLKAFF